MDKWRDRLVELKLNMDKRGVLVPIEENKDIPFGIKRVFYIYGVPESGYRGNHAHVDSKQAIFCVSGSFILDVDGDKYYMINNGIGVYVDAGEHVILNRFTKDAVCLVFVSNYYSEEDYITKEAWYGETITDSISASETAT